MMAFDARCLECGSVHIIWLPWDIGHEEGEIIKYAHDSLTDQACGEYAPHRLESRLNGLAGTEKWGPDGTADG